MPKLVLHKDIIDAIPLPAKGFIEFTDAKIPGLKLRIFASGQRSWSVKYRPIGSTKSEKRFPLDDYPNMTVADARKAAEAVRGQRTGGADPAAEREAIKAERRRKETEEVLTIDKAVELYTPALKQRKSSWTKTWAISPATFKSNSEPAPSTA